jgi:hypothetical protein
MAINPLFDAYVLYENIRSSKTKYDEETHCPMIIEVLADKDRGTHSAFCIEAGISEDVFWKWKQKYPLFHACHSLGKMFAREVWEEMGRQIRHEVSLPGTTNNAFEYWKLIGWSRFGISKNSRIRLELDPKDTPDKHYEQLIRQATEGCFTAGEIKQLMEAVNVGLNTHQAFGLQREIDELKKDLETMKANSNADNTFANKGSA